MALADAVREWDGKSAEDISGIFQDYGRKPGFVDQVVDSIGNPETERGMTWLLKAWLESGERLNSKQLSRIYRSLNELQHWEGKLHILQCIPHMPVPAANKENVEWFLREALSDNNKFIRAWGYNGFHQLAQQFPEYQTEVDQFIELAMRDEAASVKARIRNMLKQSEK